MDEQLIITGINSAVNPGNNAFNMTPAATVMPSYIFPFPWNCNVIFYIDRFVFKTNGEVPKHDFYTILN